MLAIDAGTTGIRALVFGDEGRLLGGAHREFKQYFPRPGWVEHDLAEIWNVTLAVMAEARAGAGGDSIAAIGITNQRETACAWSRSTSEPLARAIVWQDRRTSARCESLLDSGFEKTVRSVTGLVLDPYFSATKFEWLLSDGGIDANDDLALGTIDSWLLWRLTGGAVHATDWSNAARTMLFDLDSLAWSDELCATFSVPVGALPAAYPSCSAFGMTDPTITGGRSIPIGGIAGDQQAALFGQACVDQGMSKNTYGTGSFVLLNTGGSRPPTAPGLLTTVAWGIDEEPTYAYEGSIFSTGSAIQWLRDGLGVIDEASQAGPLAESVADTGGVYFVPAFTGLGSPWWDPRARGTIVGLTRGTGRAELVRAVVESMAYQTRDVVEAMTAAAGLDVKELRVDGGASVMDFLCQFQANQLGITVRRPAVTETTALGAAYLAGLSVGVWGSVAEVAENWREEATFEARSDDGQSAERHRRWLDAVGRSRGWAND